MTYKQHLHRVYWRLGKQIKNDWCRNSVWEQYQKLHRYCQRCEYNRPKGIIQETVYV